ncbi:hypothetical protein D3C84_1122520 [compost metagenome]
MNDWSAGEARPDRARRPNDSYQYVRAEKSLILGGVLNQFPRRVVALKRARQGAGRWKWSLPFQGLQRSLARFKAQPEGPGLLLCRAALLEAYLE